MVRPKRKKNQRNQRKKRDFLKKKFCKFCVDKVDLIDYKDTNRFKRYLTERGKIVPRRISGNCTYHQRKLAKVIKKARMANLLPFIAE